MIERMYPGVYVSELPFAATAIDGVPTSTAGLREAAGSGHAISHAFSDAIGDAASAMNERAASPPDTPPAPQWTDFNRHDPGITLAELLAWPLEALPYRTLPAHDPATRVQLPPGRVAGLGIEPSGTAGTPRLSISAGLALGRDGHELVVEHARLIDQDPRPDTDD